MKQNELLQEKEEMTNAIHSVLTHSGFGGQGLHSLE